MQPRLHHNQNVSPQKPNQEIDTGSKTSSPIPAKLYKESNIKKGGEIKAVCEIPLLWLKRQTLWPRRKVDMPVRGGAVEEGNGFGIHLWFVVCGSEQRLGWGWHMRMRGGGKRRRRMEVWVLKMNCKKIEKVEN